MDSKLLVVEDLHTYYRTRDGEQVHAVSGVSFELEEGRVLGIAGESGCGKSTLALSLMGFYFPPLYYKSGVIAIRGVDIMKLEYEKLRVDYLGKEISYIPQAAMNALNPTRKIGDFVVDVVQVHRPSLTEKEILTMAAERFESLNLPSRILRAFPTELSGGMKQRTVIAISTLLDPKILIADEPTSALDVSSQKAVIRMLRLLMRERVIKAMIFITHELPLLYHVADDIAVMYAGQLVEKGTAREVIFDPLHPYSHALMGSILVPDEEFMSSSRTIRTIPGAPPNLKEEIRGCRFADRCPYAFEACREHAVAERPVGKRMYRCLIDVEDLKERYAHGE